MATFTREELAILTKQYRLAIKPEKQSPYTTEAKNLLDYHFCYRYLQRIMPILSDCSLQVTSTLFSKRYSFLTMAAALFSMSRLNKGLDVSAERTLLSSQFQNGVWIPFINVEDLTVGDAPTNRDVWRDETLSMIFAQNIEKVWNSIATVASVSKESLWQNTAMYVHYVYDHISDYATEAELSQLEEDYRYIMLDAPGEVFGEHTNPLAPFNEALKQQDAPLRFRKSCCFYFLTEEEQNHFCPVCLEAHNCRLHGSITS